jgi:Cu-Zn family superoxide dismutase
MNLPSGRAVGHNSEKLTCAGGIFAVHIHEGTSCTGNETDPFANAMTHFNLNDCGHPYHAGDMPPLFENEGYALSVFVTNRFKVEDVIGKAVIVHDNRDDFTTQPAGDSGRKIACGIIEATSV